MNPVNFEGSNAVMSLEGCNDLHVLRGMQEVEGMGVVPVHISVWELSTEDVINILRTQQIRLTIVGTGQPPVLLEVVVTST